MVSLGSHSGFDGASLATFNLLSLRFADPQIEQTYNHDQLLRSLPIIRSSLFCGSVIYSLFGFLDLYLIDRHLGMVLAVRYLLGVGGLLLVIAFTYSEQFLRHSQSTLAFAMFNSGLGMIIMTAIIDEPANYLYYGGLLCVILYSLTLIRLRFQYSLCVSAALFILYCISAIVVNPVPEWTLYSNLAFLGLGVGVATFSNYATELHLRQKFAQNLALRRANEVAMRLKNEAEQASQAKTEFLATMSHELRTPLNAVLGFSEVLQSEMFGPLGSARYAEYAGDIHSSAEHLLEIINDILDIAKADAGKFELTESEVEVTEVVDKALRICHQLAVRKGIRLTTDLPEWTPVINVDARLMRQVVVNLVTNAIKFTPSAGEVNVRVHVEDGGSCRITVQDTGIGIAPEHQQRIFEPFVQIQSAFARDHGGTGLGLPLVQRIVSQHGGVVRLSSRPGEGTKVVVELPRERTVRFAELEEIPALKLGSA